MGKEGGENHIGDRMIRFIEKLDYFLRMSIIYYYLTYLRFKGYNIPHTTRVRGYFTVIGNPSNLKMGNFCSINKGVFINCRDRVVIGNNVTLSPYVQIHTGMINIENYDLFLRRKHAIKPVVIEDNVWIASSVIISPGVRIGKNSVIGAGSVVTRDIPPNSLAVGCPARVVKKLW